MASGVGNICFRIVDESPGTLVLRGVKIPDGYEATGEYRTPNPYEPWLSVTGKVYSEANPSCGNRIILRRKWQWPSWLKAPYIAMDEGGMWYAFERKPKLDTNIGVWSGTDNDNSCLDSKLYDFAPPPCTDWRDSLMKNPNA